MLVDNHKTSDDKAQTSVTTINQFMGHGPQYGSFYHQINWHLSHLNLDTAQFKVFSLSVMSVSYTIMRQFYWAKKPLLVCEMCWRDITRLYLLKFHIRYIFGMCIWKVNSQILKHILLLPHMPEFVLVEPYNFLWNLLDIKNIATMMTPTLPHDIYKLDGHVTKMMVSGDTADIIPFHEFGFWDWVEFV